MVQEEEENEYEEEDEHEAEEEEKEGEEDNKVDAVDLVSTDADIVESDETSISGRRRRKSGSSCSSAIAKYNVPPGWKWCKKKSGCLAKGANFMVHRVLKQ